MKLFVKQASPSLFVLACCLACPAYAQQEAVPGEVAGPGQTPVTPETAAQEEGSPVASTPKDTGEIIVTARKRLELLRDVPIAATVLGPALLQQKNITQVVDLTVTVPNLTYSTASTQPQLFIRGFGSGTNSGFDQSVAKFVDNVYLGRDQDGKLPIFDVERVEVLKGPQVVTFGNSATAGAINVTTRRPGTTLSADGNASYEFVNDEYKLQGGITIPLSDWASFRIAGIGQNLARPNNYNALRDRREVQIRIGAVRPSLLLTPVENLTVRLMGELDRVRYLGTPLQPVMQPRRPGAPQYPEVGDKDRADFNYTRAPVSSEDISELRHGMGLVDIQYDVFGGSLVSTTAYRKERNLAQFGQGGFNNNETFWQHGLQRYNQTSEELRFGGTYGAFDINVGGYYEHSNLHLSQVSDFLLGGFGTTGVAATPLAKVAYLDQKYDKYSGVVDGTYRLGGGFSVSAGVRFSRYIKDGVQQAFGATIPPGLNFDTDRSYYNRFRSAAIEAILPAVAGTTPHLFEDLKTAESHWQPQVIGQYKFGENMLYAKYIKGAKSGGFDYNYGPANRAGVTFGPERAESYEAGAKGRVLDNKLDYAVTYFRETFTGLQQSVFVNTSFIVTNVGKARSQGVELELDYRPVEGLRLGFNGSYLDAKYIDNRNAACNTVQLLTTPVGCLQDLSGARLQFASKWTGSFSADYEQPVGSYVAAGGASVFARTRFNTAGANDPGAVQNGFAQIDAHLDLRPDQGWWTLSVFGRNLTNKRYLTYAVPPPGNSTALVGGYERGRQIGLRLGFRY